MIRCFTSFTLGYLPRARILAETLRAVHPDWHLTALLVDRLPPGADLSAFDAVVAAESLAIPRFRAWLFRHDLVEACCAVKGTMLCRLLDAGAEAVVYLDPDIALFHPLASLAARLAHASVLLTPHQLTPNDSSAAIADNEAAALRYGVFNLGFLAVANDATGRRFAAWWAARLLESCYDAPEQGMFADQRVCDLVPALFERVGIVRDPGWNVASWNLSRRRLAVTPAGGITADGAPLAFYHFSKHGGAGDAMTDRYAGDLPLAHELWRWYGRRLAALTGPPAEQPGWHYARFSDGAAVPRAARLLHRARPDLLDAFDDPFDAARGGLRDWLAAYAPETLAPPPDQGMPKLKNTPGGGGGV